MKEQILLLIALQHIDSRVNEVRAMMKSLPERLEPAKRDLAKLDSMLQVQKDRLAETEAWRKQQEDHLRLDEDSLKKAKVKLQAAKTSKDFAAASREVDNKKRSINERETELLRVMEALDANRAEIEGHEKDVDELRQHVATDEADVKKKLAVLERDAKKAASGRGVLVKQIDNRTMMRYEKTLKARGFALAPVVNGTCQGCHMSIPPQLNNILARGSSVEICPRCHRIIYRIELVEDGEAAAE